MTTTLTLPEGHRIASDNEPGWTYHGLWITDAPAKETAAALQQRYDRYVRHMEDCYLADVRRYGAGCQNAFIPRSFAEWKNTAIEVRTDSFGSFFVTVLDEQVGPSFTTSEAAHTYAAELKAAPAPTAQPAVTKRIGEYDPISKDFPSYVIFEDGHEEYIGSRPTQHDASLLASDYIIQWYSDNHTPEKAAQLIHEELAAEGRHEQFAADQGLCFVCGQAEHAPETCPRAALHEIVGGAPKDQIAAAYFKRPIDPPTEADQPISQRIAGTMTGECSACGTVQPCFWNGKGWVCVDLERCNALYHVAQGRCACGGSHPPAQCPQIGAALLAPGPLPAPTCTMRGCGRPATMIGLDNLPVCDECDRAGLARLKAAIFGPEPMSKAGPNNTIYLADPAPEPPRDDGPDDNFGGFRAPPAARVNWSEGPNARLVPCAELAQLDTTDPARFRARVASLSAADLERQAAIYAAFYSRVANQAVTTEEMLDRFRRAVTIHKARQEGVLAATPLHPVQALKLALERGVFGLETLAVLRASYEAAEAERAAACSWGQEAESEPHAPPLLARGPFAAVRG